MPKNRMKKRMENPAIIKRRIVVKNGGLRSVAGPGVLFFFILFGAPMLVPALEPSKGQDSVKEGKPRPAGTILPLGIAAETPMNKIELVLGFYSSKSGAGVQEIALRADGTVTLFYSRSYADTHPKVLKAKCPRNQVLRLLEFLEEMGFLDFPGEIGSGNAAPSRRIIKLTMPGREKIVAVDEPGNYAVEQCIGAIKLCAAMCIPEAIHHRFFPNL